MDKQESCNFCGKTEKEQAKGCNIAHCYRQYLNIDPVELFRMIIKGHEGITNGKYWISTNDAAISCARYHEIEIRKWRELVENLKLDYGKKLDELTNENFENLKSASTSLLNMKNERDEALRDNSKYFNFIMEYQECVESIVGFSGPIERVKQELDLLMVSRTEFLDEIDKTRLGLCLIKEMIEDDKFDKIKAIEILEKAL